MRHFNVLVTVSANSQDSAHKPQFWKRKEKRGLSAYQHCQARGFYSTHARRVVVPFTRARLTHRSNDTRRRSQFGKCCFVLIYYALKQDHTAWQCVGRDPSVGNRELSGGGHTGEHSLFPGSAEWSAYGLKTPNLYAAVIG